MRRSRRQDYGGSRKGFGGSHQSSQVARILNAVDNDIQTVVDYRYRFQARPGQRRDRQDSPGRVCVTELLEQSRFRFGNLQLAVREQLLPGLAGQEIGGSQGVFETEAGLQGFPDQVWPLEDRPVTFTPQESANILDLLILTTDDHGQRS